MSLLRSERAAAIALVIAAALGLAITNSPLGAAVLDLAHTYVGIPGTVWHLSLTHWVADGLLVVFFFVAAIELRHELTVGSLRSPARAALPAIAAAGGVLVPIGGWCPHRLAPQAGRGRPPPPSRFRSASSRSSVGGSLPVCGRSYSHWRSSMTSLRS